MGANVDLLSVRCSVKISNSSMRFFSHHKEKNAVRVGESPYFSPLKVPFGSAP